MSKNVILLSTDGPICNTVVVTRFYTGNPAISEKLNLYYVLTMKKVDFW